MIPDDKILAFRALLRAALRAGRTFVVFLVALLVVLTISGGLCSCTGTSSAAPDGPLASCAEVGCGGDEPLLCTRLGVCECPQDDGGKIQCERERVDAGVDAAANSIDAQIDGAP